MGCTYILWQSYEMKRERERQDAYQVILQEGLFDIEGHLLSGQGFTTGTASMTPLLAALYNTAAGRPGLEAAFGAVNAER